IFAIGISLFLFSFSLGNIAEVFSENWYIGQYGLFGAPIFAALLAYLIVKFKTFNIKLIAPQVLVFSLIFLNIAMLFVRSIENIRYVLIPTIIVSSVVSWILIRSVKQVDNQRELLDLANKEQENLIHFISHQVKGFFTKSRNIFDTLNSEPDSIDETLRPLIAEGLRSDNEGITVVTNILNAANLKTGKVNYISNKLYLNTLLDKIIEKEKPLAEKKGLQLIYNSDGKLLEFSGDEIRLQDAILNIIQNAINYTEKGSITVTLSRDDIAKKIRITINDTGVGLTDSDKSKLFKSGSRGADSLKYNVNSTGYGLFIAKQVIEKHGGTITANSEGRDMGSTFVIELPLK
ncbi:MAG TPA: HAMP domain-containing sensor histidine kinase, partial [Candidatus Paceibacterota bacterium]|nr:HAMP domain-containing sensor histidine kinase [Candidatus Paceibacterota bacterium]